MKYRIDLDLYAKGHWMLGNDEETYDTLEEAQNRIDYLMRFEREIAENVYAKKGIPFAVYRATPVAEGNHERN